MIPTTTLYTLIGAAVVTLGSLGYAAYEHQRAERYQVEKKSAEDEVTRLLASVGSKDVVIGELRSALKNWETKATAGSRAADEAAQKSAGLEQQVRAQQNTITRLRESDNALPACEALLKTDFAAVCPGAATGLREWSRRGLQGQTGAGANPSTEEAGQPAH